MKGFKNTHRLIPGSAILGALFLTLFAGTAYPATTVISSLPYTASQTGTNYSETLLVAGTNLSTGGSALNVSGHDVVIYLVNDTITFGTDGGSSYYGIQLSSSSYNIKIIGGTIYHGGTGDRNVCLRLAGSNDVLIEGTNMRVAGSNGHCIYSPSLGAPGNYNVEISGGRYRSDVTGYTSRCNYDGSAIYLTTTYSGYGDYHFKVHGINLETGPSQGMILTGRSGGNDALVFVYACTLQSDARNDFYTSGDNTCRSAANPYQIIGGHLAGGSEIHDNVITSGTNYGGSRGMIFEMCSGTPDNYVKVYNNYIDIHEGPNLEAPQGNVQVLRIRFGNKYIHVYDNTFIGTGSVSHGSSYGAQVSVFRITATDEEGHTPDHGIIIERNLFRAEALSSGVKSLAAVFEGFSDLGNIYRYNRFESSGDIICFGETNYGAYGLMLYADTLVRLSPSYNPRTVVVGWQNWFSASDDTLRDCVYLGGASDADIVFAEDRSDYRLEKIITVQVIGNNALPVRQAAVSVVNNYGRTVLNGTTNSFGIVTGPVTYHWEQHTGSDSTDYNDFTVKAKKGSDSTILSFTVDASSTSSSLVLANTPGEEPQTDTTPPGAVNGLNATPGVNHGEINLSWTAPGDDGYTGTADRYVIKYSISIITEANWSSATIVPNPPSPAAAGSPENFTIDGLSEGYTYYVAIKTYDEEDNVSDLSNVPQTYAAGIMTPTPTGTAVDSVNGSVTVTCEQVTSYYTLSYQFALDTIVTFPTPRLKTGSTAGSTAWTIFDQLVGDEIYYWRCRAVAGDISDSSAWSSIQTFDFSNNTPGAPGHVSPPNGDTTTADPIVLVVNNAFDADGDPLTYDFWISDDSIFVTVLDSVMNVVEGTDQTSAVFSSFSPQDGQRYWWRCRANDGTTSSDKTTPTWFVYTHLSTGEDDYMASPTGPQNGAVVLTDRPVLTASNIAASSQNYYSFEVALDSGFFTPVLSSPPIPEADGDYTSWKVTEKLESGQTYFWRVQANDSAYSAVSSFTVDFQIYASPNPVRFRQGEYVTFHLPDETVDLLIQTVSGETVLVEHGIFGDWAWYGANASGQNVAIGTYLWYVPGTPFKGKILVKP